VLGVDVIVIAQSAIATDMLPNTVGIITELLLGMVTVISMIVLTGESIHETVTVL
jgi:hypothetical protein